MTELPAGLSLPGPLRLEQQPKPLTLHPDSGAHRAVPGPQPEKCKRLWWPQQRAQGTQPVCWGGDGVWVQGYNFKLSLFVLLTVKYCVWLLHHLLA